MSFLVLFLFVVSVSATLNQLSGEFVNELGSNMTLNCGMGDHFLTGQYHSTVGDAPGEYWLSGRASACYIPATLGFCVVWNGTIGSTTCWTGHLMKGPDGHIILDMFWVLVSAVPNPSDLWLSTNLGQNIFRKHN